MKKVYSAPQSAVEKKVLRASILTGSTIIPNGENTGIPVGGETTPENSEAEARSRNSLD